MPLPATSERAARAVARVLADLDAAVVDYLAGRRPSLPTVAAIIRDLRPLVTASVSAALSEVNPDVPLSVVREAVNGQLNDLQTAITAALADARIVKRRMPTKPPSQDDDETWLLFLKRVGKFAALAVLLAEAKGKRDMAQLARRVSVRVPRKTAGYGRMLVRTRTAIARNEHSADVVETKFKAKRAESGVKSTGAVPGDWVVLVLDARKGPTDQDCEDVNRRYATPAWIREHPVEHPNCTRMGKPVTLPKGEAVTLIS